MTLPFSTPSDAAALLLRVTALFAAGEVLLWISRRLPAAQRHALCAFTLGGSLLIPLLTFAASYLPSPAPALTVHFQSWPTAGPRGSAPVEKSLVFLWLTGALLLMLRNILGLLYVSRKTQAGIRVANREWSTSLQEAAATLGLDPATVTLKTAAVSTPLVWGYARPAILLPRDAVQWAASRRRLVLLHELAHIQRRDLWTNLLSAFATSLYWFHPLSWHLATKLTEAQEQACDAAVLHAGSDPQAYAALLVTTAREFQGPHPFATCPMTRGLEELRQRLQLILTPASSRTRFWQRALIPTLAGVLLLTGALHPIHADDTEPLKIGGEVLPPHLIHKVEPAYTDAARDAKIEGPVILSIVIDPAGHPQQIQVVSSLDPGLDRNAITAVQQWRFAPATRKGNPVAVTATVEVQFRLL